MATHFWGDKDFDWEGLNKVMRYIYNYVYKRSLVRVSMKEKFGTIRYEWIFIPGESVRAGFRITLPFFRRKSKYIKEGMPIVIWSWYDSIIARLWRRYGYWLLKRAIFKAVAKWPHLEDEIFEDAPEELIGEEIYSRYWVKQEDKDE